jgi:hypothetical protein
MLFANSLVVLKMVCDILINYYQEINAGLNTSATTLLWAANELPLPESDTKSLFLLTLTLHLVHASPNFRHLVHMTWPHCFGQDIY